MSLRGSRNFGTRATVGPKTTEMNQISDKGRVHSKASPRVGKGQEMQWELKPWTPSQNWGALLHVAESLWKNSGRE